MKLRIATIVVTAVVPAAVRYARRPPDPPPPAVVMRTEFGAVVDEARTRSVEFSLRVPDDQIGEGSPEQYVVARVLVELAGRREAPCDGLRIPMPDGDVALCREPYDHVRIVRHVGALRCSAVSSLDDGEHEAAIDACFSLRVLR